MKRRRFPCPLYKSITLTLEYLASIEMADGSRPLKAVDIKRFLAAKAVNGNCAACGIGQFLLLDEELINARLALPALKRDGDGSVSVGVFEVVVSSCANCGNVRFFERKLLVEWLALNG